MIRKVVLLFLLGFPFVLFANDGLQFIENKGQSHPNVYYEASLPGGKVYLENNRWTFDFIKYPAHTHKLPSASHHNHDHGPEPAKGHAYRMNFIGANQSPKLRSSRVFETYHNYFKGNDPDKWAGNVRLFGEVFYEDIYECIDLDVYSQGNNLKYDFIVHPDGIASDILISYEGVEDVFLKNGSLVIKTSINEIRELKPYAYQIVGGKEKKVKCEFVLEGNRLSFYFPRGYNANLPLIIDPELVFGSYTGASADNWGYTATYDDEGNLYGGGIVFNSGYPISVGAYDTNFNLGDCDIGLTKFSSDGSSLIYSTYIGGVGSEQPHSLIVNNQNQLVMLGTTSSSNYPALGVSYDNSFAGGDFISLGDNYLQFPNGSDIVITVFDASGASLIGSTYFGGSENDGMNNTNSSNLEYNYGDQARGEVYVDSEDNIYIGSCTRSNLGGGGTIQSNLKGKQDGLIAKFNPNVSNLDWYTYVGGNENDAVYSLKTDEFGNVFACGGTQGSSFLQMNGINTSYKGGQSDGFIVKISNNGQNLLAGTFIGTNDYDQAYFIEIDKFGKVYVVGQTEGAYPITGNVYVIPGTKQFIHKLNSNLNSTEWSTTFGSGNRVNISPTAFLVDICGRIYVSGWGGDINTSYNGAIGNTSNLPTTIDAFQNNTDGSDLYFYVLEKDASGLLYASYYGGTSIFDSGEHVDGGTSRFDKKGTIYQAVCASCDGGNNFPTTPGAWSSTNGSDKCNLGVLKFNFEPNLVLAEADIGSALNFGCAPYVVNFQNTGTTAQNFLWNFGDGFGSNEENPTHTFETLGEFTVTLLVVDSTTCNILDSSAVDINIIEYAEEITTEYTVDLPELCDPYVVGFNNISVYDGTDDQYTFIWDMGNGVVFNTPEVTYEYPIHGIYSTSLTIIGQEPCLVEDTYEVIIEIPENPIVYADFSSPDQGCIPFSSTFEALDDAEEYLWDLGDGTIETGPLVEHTYETVGTYTIQLIATDTSTCNKIDTSRIEFEVFESPVASFTYEQPEPYILVPIGFSNATTPDGMEFLWDFGDGTTSEEMNPVHSYLLTGDIEVCLTATNPEGGCSDTYCDNVFISDEFLLAVPTAFSPNGDGINDTYSVQGFGVENYRLRIFNRWGQKVYETTNVKDRWDGRFNGEAQDIGVFVYYVEATVAGSREYFDKGNITLIR